MGRSTRRRVIAEFKRRRTRANIATVLAVAVMIPLAVLLMLLEGGSERLSGSPVGMIAVTWCIVAFVVVLGSLVFQLVNWRCPACEGYLGNVRNPRFCQKCGAQLQD